MSAANDGSESVDQFLARIASVKEGRDKDSEERTRRLEEDFLKNRKERQARRLERARSISPSKTGPSRPTSIVGSPAPIRDVVLNPPVDFSPPKTPLSRSNATSLKTSPKLDPQHTEPAPAQSPASEISSPPTTTLARSGTLSWQQRSSRDGALGRLRPLSGMSPVRSVPKEEVEPASSTRELSREEIAASLGSKDASWFRQTQDRGTGSAAYRKNQVEDTPAVDINTRSMRLPGLSREETTTTQDTPQVLQTDAKQKVARSLPEKPIERITPVRSSESPKPIHDVGQPELPAAADHESVFRRSGGGQLSAARSPSPTKGLGGFVQSAMMKRSDSVSKRWSVQANTGLKRGDSVAGMRPFSVIGSPPKPPASQDKDFSRNSPDLPNSSTGNVRLEMTPTSRPLSSHEAEQLPARNKDASTTRGSITKSTDSPGDAAVTSEDFDLSRSPSKTMDPRRWSPTKSSWLESTLLANAEPAKIPPKKEEQPQWMVNLQRTRSTRSRSPEKRAGLANNSSAPEPAATTSLSNSSKSIKEAKVEENVGRPKTTPVKGKSSAALSAWENLQSSSEPPAEERSELAEVSKSDVDTDNADSKSQSDIIPHKQSLSTRKPPVLKSKPQTPPKTDLRATLRARAPTAESKQNSEPEFKSIFGKLKSAQTKNYVAPDTFKDNILSGKAALNVTGGPQKSQRVDEFKESILQKKEAMKMGALEKKENPQSPEPKPITSLPEALQRRKTLHKASPSITKLQEAHSKGKISAEDQPQPKALPAVRSKPSQPFKPATPVKAEMDRPKADAGLESRAVHTRDTAIAPVEPKPSGPVLAQKPQEKAVMHQSAVAQNNGLAESNKDPLPSDVATTVSVTATTSNKLASRLNPNLAAFLSRGASPRPVPSGTPSSESIPQSSSFSPTREITQAEGTTAELTHMTKGRARGPKRRAPKAQDGTESKRVTREDQNAPKSVVSEITATDTITTPSKPASTDRVKGQFSSSAITRTNASTPREDGAKPGLGDAATLLLPESKVTTPRARPAVTAKSPELRRVSSSSTPNPKPAELVQPPTSTSKTAKVADPKALMDESKAQPIVSRAATISMSSLAPQPLTPSKTRVNVPKQPSPAVSTPPKPSSPNPLNGLSIAKATPQRVPSPLTVPKPASLKANISDSSTDKIANVSGIVSSYFRSSPSSKDKIEFDTQALLEKSKTEPSKVKTVSNTIWELNGDGRKIVMPPQQEHILYEESMYLMIHTFEPSGSGKQSEAFLWCGDRVSEASANDVQIFCKRDARDHNAKLEVLKQGREPASFFQALGGIVITRRSKSSSLYMLCGRKHLGHIAFDEVDLAPSNLCSGFPYLISAKFGSLYLWKGKGSAIDEVGCARLIGMDLGLTGEIEEIDEGAETDAFWEAFPDLPSSSTQNRPSITSWANEWHARAEHWGYPCTLYRLEQEVPKSAGGFWGLRPTSPAKPTGRAAIETVTPASQHDLDPDNVYIFDAYHSVYVLLTLQATTSKPTEAITALHLAQEIALLSPSIQTRRLQPSCYVVFGDPPPDVKACFRKWVDKKPNGTNNSTDLEDAHVRLEDVLQALGL